MQASSLSIASMNKTNQTIGEDEIKAWPARAYWFRFENNPVDQTRYFYCDYNAAKTAKAEGAILACDSRGIRLYGFSEGESL
jgi:hypothetical protein